jgi:hypothetical protein
LEGGVIARVRSAQGEVKEYHAKPDSLFKKLTLVVLVNRGTRAEAELLAAALQDNRRALLIGEGTWGEGYVETVFDLPDDVGAIALRTAVMQRADGREIRRPGNEDGRLISPITGNGDLEVDPPGDWGVHPDNVVPMDRNQMMKWLAWRREQESAQAIEGAPAEPPMDPQFANAVQKLREMLNFDNDEMAKRAQM